MHRASTHVYSAAATNARHAIFVSAAHGRHANRGGETMPITPHSSPASFARDFAAAMSSHHRRCTAAYLGTCSFPPMPLVLFSSLPSHHKSSCSSSDETESPPCRLLATSSLMTLAVVSHEWTAQCSTCMTCVLGGECAPPVPCKAPPRSSITAPCSDRYRMPFQADAARGSMRLRGPPCMDSSLLFCCPHRGLL